MSLQMETGNFARWTEIAFTKSGSVPAEQSMVRVSIFTVFKGKEKPLTWGKD